MKNLINQIAKRQNENTDFIVSAVLKHNKKVVLCDGTAVDATLELHLNDVECFVAQTASYSKQAMEIFKVSSEMIEHRLQKRKKISEFPFTYQLQILESLIKDEKGAIEAYLQG